LSHREAHRPTEGENDEGQDRRIQSGAELPGTGLQAVEERAHQEATMSACGATDFIRVVSQASWREVSPDE